tara:strand:- start:6656 stop:6997 length:342 start_codon:yes stop_codon:yes gene_type:complete
MNFINTKQELKGRVEYLKILRAALVGTNKDGATKLVIKAEKERIKNELVFLNKEKEFTFGFQGSGWNTMYAKTKDVAIARAKKLYNSKNSKVDDTSFRIATDEETQGLLSLFY